MSQDPTPAEARPSQKDPTLPYDMPLVVQPSDIDMIGHVNNTIYLKWVQEAATEHWDVIAHEDDHEQMFWVVTRHEIDYKRGAFEGDELIVRTWLGQYEHHKCERFTSILRVRDGKELAAVRTLWHPINQQTKKAIRLSPEQIARYSVAPNKD
ncbi:acyl-CoA thioesterase [Cohaesibacter haloalkalitolerans]|uniref:acyl-CoA thioesterase n=1 Tax=Cohaesibacter haloalkalitolerans TaxID=1162980 RepID=UPI000E651054|nr:acyl-CoA thioesterase [Cohaesibacter haloalkalitolerans]